MFSEENDKIEETASDEAVDNTEPENSVNNIDDTVRAANEKKSQKIFCICSATIYPAIFFVNSINYNFFKQL